MARTRTKGLPPQPKNEVLRQGTDRLNTQAHASKSKANDCGPDKPHGQQGRMGDLPPASPTPRPTRTPKVPLKSRNSCTTLREDPQPCSASCSPPRARAAAVDQHAAHGRQEGLDQTANREGGSHPASLQ